ncbi:hypothetical protein BDAP_001996 [Binucleata daphniae]
MHTKYVVQGCKDCELITFVIKEDLKVIAVPNKEYKGEITKYRLACEQKLQEKLQTMIKPKNQDDDKEKLLKRKNKMQRRHSTSNLMSDTIDDIIMPKNIECEHGVTCDLIPMTEI